MKKCQTCGNQNSDDMRFCLNCGTQLPDAPIVFNLGGSPPQSGQSSPGTNPYGKSMETQFGGRSQQQQQQPYSMVPQSRPGGNKKIFIAIGGVIAMFLLVLLAVGGIVGYNIMKSKPTPTPMPSVTPSASPSSSPSASPTSSSSPTPKPTSTTKSNTNAKVKFEKTWVDYNVTEDGSLGMRIHVKFEVWNMKDVDSYVIVFFQKSDGTNLRNGSGEYSTNDGRIAAKKSLKPGFDDTVYNDLQIFMPYSELGLSSGKYDLKMDIDLTDDNEGFIEHLTFHEFQYEKD